MHMIDSITYKCDYCGNTSHSEEEVMNCEKKCISDIELNVGIYTSYALNYKKLGRIDLWNIGDAFRIVHSGDRTYLLETIAYIIKNTHDFPYTVEISDFIEQINLRKDIEELNFLIVSLGNNYDDYGELNHSVSFYSPDEWNGLIDNCVNKTFVQTLDDIATMDSMKFDWNGRLDD